MKFVMLLFKNFLFCFILLKTFNLCIALEKAHFIEKDKSLQKFNFETLDDLFLEHGATFVVKNVKTKIRLAKNVTENSNKKEGDFCRRSFDGRGGYCTLAHKCLHVMREHRKHGIKVDFCEHRKNIPVICCPLEEKHVVKSRISAIKCQEYHNALKGMQLTTPRTLTGNKCVSSVPMIVGGKPTQPGAFPHMAALGWTQDDNTIQWNCGGSLISDQFVITAAHCATLNAKPMDIVRLGALKLNETTSRFKRDIKILMIIVPPNYNTSSHYNDIAIIKLTRRVRFTERVRPACLWQQPIIPTRNVIATGWGRTQFLGSSSNDLLKVDLDLIDQHLCSELYQKERRLKNGIKKDQFCAGYMQGGKDTCQGDSGGPLHIELPEYNCVKFVVGITSFGKFCAAPNAPGVYTKIYSYLDWIEDVVFKSHFESN